MALNFDEFMKKSEFTIHVADVGDVACSGLSVSDLQESSAKLRSGDADPYEFSRWLLTRVGTRGGAGNGEGGLTLGDLSPVSRETLDEFARNVVDKNWFLTKDDKDGDLIRKSDMETDAQFLVRAIIDHRDKERKWLRDLARNAVFPFSESTIKELARNFDLSDQLRAESASFRGQFGGDVGRGGRLDEFIKVQPLPDIPENPAYETNRILADIRDDIEGAGSLVVRCADLIGNMNDVLVKMQAEYIEQSAGSSRKTLIALWIGALGLVFSAIASCVTLWQVFWR